MITEEVDTADGRKKLYQKIHRIRTKLGKGRHQLTIAELDDFIKVHTEIPSNELYVNMIVSSQTIVNRLLKRPVRHQIQVDFTYDVSVDNLMILMIGTSNEGHEYLPIAVVLTNRENEKSVRDVFQWLKTEIEGSVESVMADGARAFSNAIYAEFEEAVHLMCYSHVVFRNS